MEGMNLEIVDMIHQPQYLTEYRESKETGKAQKDGFGYSFEPIEAFSTEPLNFTETAMRLHTEALELFNLAGTANRHSPLYYRMSGQLEKLVSQLGSCCITKAVLEQQGNEFDLLDDLTIETLRRMTAHNFRKAWSSFMESRAANNYNGTALDLSIRWAALDKRLLATEEKIKKIHAGEIKIDTAVKEKAAGNKNQTEKASEPEEPARPFDPQARAFPVDKAAVREAGQQASEAQAEETAHAKSEVSKETLPVPEEKANVIKLKKYILAHEGTIIENRQKKSVIKSFILSLFGGGRK